MAERKTLFRWIFLYSFVGVTLIMLFASPAKVEEAVLNERAYIIKTMGRQSEAQQWAQAERMAAPVVSVCTGDGVSSLVHGNQKYLPYNRQKVGRWLDQRAETCAMVAQAVAYRVTGSLIWLPLILPLLFATTVDAYAERKVRNCRFSFPSPGVQHLTTNLVRVIVGALIISLFVPTTVHPYFYPVFILVMIVTVWAWLVNLQKRI